MERKLIADYEATVQMLLDGLEDDRLSLAVEIASIPEHIRGFGHVKEAHFEQAKAREAACWRSGAIRRRCISCRWRNRQQGPTGPWPTARKDLEPEALAIHASERRHFRNCRRSMTFSKCYRTATFD